MSARLVAAGHIRALALSGASEIEASRALLAELSELLRTYTRRDTMTVDGETSEVVSSVGSAKLRQWWREHASRLIELQREIARAHLAGAGVLA